MGKIPADNGTSELEILKGGEESPVKCGSSSNEKVVINNKPANASFLFAKSASSFWLFEPRVMYESRSCWIGKLGWCGHSLRTCSAREISPVSRLSNHWCHAFVTFSILQDRFTHGRLRSFLFHTTTRSYSVCVYLLIKSRQGSFAGFRFGIFTPLLRDSTDIFLRSNDYQKATMNAIRQIQTLNKRELENAV